jgi:GDPmannose 4,6-dehydratase
MSLSDFRSVLQVIKNFSPDEIYNLGGQTSVALSFQQPVETLESIATGTLNILEAIRFINAPIKFYNACSSESFGNIPENMQADESTPFKPRSPYALAKATAFWEVANYREAYQIFACSGILFNHESVTRPKRFVTKKVITAASEIARGKTDRLRLGNTNIKRDWGWAPEYVEAMHLMLQQNNADDYVIATGHCNSLEDFVRMVFEKYNLDWKRYVVTDVEFIRPTEIIRSVGNPTKAKEVLGWEPKIMLEDIVEIMVNHHEKEVATFH